MRLVFIVRFSIASLVHHCYRLRAPFRRKQLELKRLLFALRRLLVNHFRLACQRPCTLRNADLLSLTACRAIGEGEDGGALADQLLCGVFWTLAAFFFRFELDPIVVLSDLEQVFNAFIATFLASILKLYLQIADIDRLITIISRLLWEFGRALFDLLLAHFLLYLLRYNDL